MDTRVNKYNDENKAMSRVSKHEDLYKRINDSELDNFSVHNNATVIGNQDQEIDIDKIKATNAGPKAFLAPISNPSNTSSILTLYITMKSNSNKNIGKNKSIIFQLPNGLSVP